MCLFAAKSINEITFLLTLNLSDINWIKLVLFWGCVLMRPIQRMEKLAKLTYLGRSLPANFSPKVAAKVGTVMIFREKFRWIYNGFQGCDYVQWVPAVSKGIDPDIRLFFLVWNIQMATGM